KPVLALILDELFSVGNTGSIPSMISWVLASAMTTISADVIHVKPHLS
ncbi:hypothetical protein A4X13_0g9662, partial [Tilletia indica]